MKIKSEQYKPSKFNALENHSIGNRERERERETRADWKIMQTNPVDNLVLFGEFMPSVQKTWTSQLVARTIYIFRSIYIHTPPEQRRSVNDGRIFSPASGIPVRRIAAIFNADIQTMAAYLNSVAVRGEKFLIKTWKIVEVRWLRGRSLKKW